MEQVLADCVANRSRTILGRSMTIGAASELEREHLSALAAEGFPVLGKKVGKCAFYAAF